MADMGDKAREEFFSEAHEIIEGLSRDLLQLDAARDKGPAEPELVNNIFRAVHTLKGLAGLFGAARMSALSHELENVLDDLRLGKIELTQNVEARLRGHEDVELDRVGQCRLDVGIGKTPVPARMYRERRSAQRETVPLD